MVKNRRVESNVSLAVLKAVMFHNMLAGCEHQAVTRHVADIHKTSALGIAAQGLPSLQLGAFRGKSYFLHQFHLIYKTASKRLLLSGTLNVEAQYGRPS